MQLIASSNGVAHIKFIYQDVEWTTGNASGGSNGLGGSPARIGYSAGDGANYYEIPESANQAALLSLPTTLGNTGQAGLFEFSTGSHGIYSLANPSVTTQQGTQSLTLNLGNVHVGGLASGKIIVSNVATAPAEALDASFVANASTVTASGAIALLAPGETNGQDMNVALNTATSGDKSATVTVMLASDGAGTSEGGVTALAARTVNVIGAVYAEAVAALGVNQYQVFHVGDIASLAVSFTNAAVSNGYSEALDASLATVGGDVSDQGQAISGLAAGATGAITLNVSTATSGLKTGSASFALASDGTGIDGLGVTALPTQSASLYAYVDNYAAFGLSASLGTLTRNGSNYTLDLGAFYQYNAAATATLSAANTADGLADLLSGSFTAIDGSGFTLTGGTFSDLGSGQSAAAVAVALSTDTLGTFSETLNINAAGYNASGYSGSVESGTLTITGTVLHRAAPDISVSAIQSPATGQTGASATINWTVTNTGDADATGPWTDIIYLASDAQGDNLRALGSLVFNGTVAAGASVTRTATVTLPGSIGDAWFIVKADAGNILVENPGASSKEAVSTAPIDISYPPAPNLAVSSIGAPVTALAGRQAVVSWTVTNSGDAAADGPWTDNVYLASDAAGDAPVFLGAFVFDGELGAGASVTRSEVVTLPGSYRGDGWFVVQADAQHQVHENPGASSETSVAASATSVAPQLFPDLAVSAVTPPSGVFSGQPTQISWVVTNTGDGATATPHWTDNVYLSLNRTLDTSAILLASVANPSYLAAGGSYQNIATVTLPKDASGAYYIIVKTNAGGQVNEGANANADVLASSSFTVEASPTPLLTPQTILGPRQAFSGQPLTLSWTVANTGAAATGNAGWTDEVLVSTSGALDSSARVVASIHHSGNVTSGGSYKESATFDLPVGVSGQETFFVVANADNGVYERVASGSTAASTTIQVNLTPPPDLQVSLLSAPRATITGHQLSLSYKVVNAGSTATPNSTWTDLVYLSASATLDASAQQLGTLSHTGALSPGQSYVNSASYQLPSNLEGQYYLIVQTDAGDQVFELDTSNNKASSAPFAIAFAPVDLIVTSVAAAATATAGHQIAINWTVKNAGSGDTGAASWRDAVILSASGVVGASDNIVLGRVSRPNGLSGGQSYSQTQTFDLPRTLAGDYKIFVIADSDRAAPQASYDDSASAPQDIVITGLSDLQAASVSAPASVTAGDVIAVSWTVTNGGPTTTADLSWTDSVYVTVNGYRRHLADFTHTGPLASGASYVGQGEVTLPSWLATGAFEIDVVTNAASTLLESDSQNNLAATTLQVQATANSGGGSSGGGSSGGGGGAVVPAAKADLAVSTVTAALTGVAGQGFTVSWTLANSGETTNRSWYDQVYLSSSPTLGAGASLSLGYLEHYTALANGGSATFQQSFTLPSGLSGPYYVIVVADKGKVLDDPNRADNSADSASPVTISLPQAGDTPASTLLSVGDISVAATASAGQPISVSYTINNLGSGASAASWVDRLYLSLDGVWSVTDPLLGSVEHNGGIAANGSYTATLQTTLPGVAAGSYHIIVRNDVYDAQPETNEGAKTGVSVDVVSVGVPSLMLGTPVSGTLSSGKSVYYQFTVDAGEVVDLKVAGGAAGSANDLYVRYGATPTIGQFDATSATPLSQNPEAILRETQAGTYYVMLRESAGADETYTLTAKTVPFSVTSVGPKLGSNAGTTTLTVDGAQFKANDTVELVNSKGKVVATAAKVEWANSGELWASFDLKGVAAGQYDVAVIDGARTVTLANGFTVTNGPVGRLSVSLVAPATLRTHVDTSSGLNGTQNGIVTVTYANVGQTDVAAPILDIQATNANFIAGATGLVGASDITIAGITQRGGPAGILQPGATETVSYTFHGYFGYAQFITMTLGLGVLQGSNTPIDLSSFADSSRPASIDATDWSLIWGRLENQLGSTTQSLIDRLSQDETTLGAIGQTTSDIATLLGYEMARASGTLSQTTLASATDFTVSSGLGLSLDRAYVSSLVARNAAGVFGDGWTFTYDIKAYTDDAGDVTIVSPAGSESFALQADGFFAAQSGDSTVLKTVNGHYVLTLVDGTVETFRADGQLSSVVGADGTSVLVGYDSNGVIASVTASDVETLSFVTNAQGRIVSASDSSGHTTTYAYDSTGTLLLSATGSGGTTTYAYDTGSDPYTHNALTQVVHADGTQQNFTYTAFGDLSGESGANGAQPVTFSYGDTGVVTETDATGAATTLIYGTNGKVARIEDAQGGVTQFKYDAAGDVTSVVTPKGETYQFTYDALGNVTSYTDPNGGVVKATYKPGTSLLASFTDQNGNTTSYSYDSADDLTGITYDDGSSDNYAYSPSGLLLSTIDARGELTTFTYDAAGNLAGESFADGTSEHFVYDSQGELISSQATDGGITSYTYNALGELTSLTDPQGRVESYGYNAQGQLIQRVEADGSIVNYSYTASGQLASLTDGSGALLVQYSYNAAGQLTGANMGNGASTVYNYDFKGNVASIVTYAANHSITSSLTYSYNADGQPVSVTSLDGTWTYGYDANGQLVHAVFASTNSAIASQDLTYKYDAAGNRTQTIFNGAVTDYATNDLNQYTSANGTTFSYDADGNLVSKNDNGQITSYSYDAQNQLVSVISPDGTLTSYKYDALGNRVAETVNGVTSQFVIDPLAISTSATGPLASIAQVYDAAGQVTATYDYGNGLAAASEQGAHYYYNSDSIGNIVSLSNSASQLSNTYLYDPSGSLIWSQTSVANSFQYGGFWGLRTSLAGLVDMQAREYDAALGRFTSMDPAGFSGGVNAYAYVNNQSTFAIDPVGLWELFVQGGGGAFYGLGGGANVGVVFTSNNAYGWPDIGLFFTAAGGVGYNTPGASAQVGFDTRPYSSFQGLNYNVEATVGDFAGSVIIDPNSYKPAGGSIGVSTPGAGGAATASYTWTFSLGENLIPWIKSLFDGSTGKTPVVPVNSVDPNDIIGPTAFGAQNFVAAATPLAYTIEFENTATATAPAQTVTITQQLDANLDWRSFRLTGFGFDNFTTTLSGNGAFYGTLLDYSATKGYDVSVGAAVDVLTGLVTWTFETIDPNTGVAPTDPQLGLLPVNNANGDGQGFVSYTIKAKAGAGTGATIVSQARVVFDTNGPIDTPVITDTIDAAAPGSTIQLLAAHQAATTFEVDWTGQDDAGGSGLASYSLYVAKDGGAQTPWLTNTTRTNALFTGEAGHTYAFYIQAADNAGNQEAPHALADATTEIGTPAPHDLVLSPESQTGPSPTMTADATPTVTGFAEAGAGVTLYDGVTAVGTAIADAATGAWSITSAQLADGAHALTAAAVNESGVASAASAPLDITIQSAVAPTISGTVGGQTTTSEASIRPFAHVTITDLNANATDSLTITLSGAGGKLADGAGFSGLIDQGGGVYGLSGSASAISSELDALAFKPNAGQPNATATSSFTLSDLSSAFPTPALDTATTVIDVDPAVAPTITGVVASQTVGLGAPVSPFGGVTIADANVDVTDTLTITVTGRAGALTGSPSLVSLGRGVYTLTGAASAITGELDALSFVAATANPQPIETTDFALSLNDGAWGSAVTAQTRVIDTDTVSLTEIVPPTNLHIAGFGLAAATLATATLTASDSSAYDAATYSTSGWSRVGSTPGFTKAGAYGVATLDTSTGQVSYQLASGFNAAVFGLTSGHSLTDSFVVAISNAAGATASQTVAFTIDGVDSSSSSAALSDGSTLYKRFSNGSLFEAVDLGTPGQAYVATDTLYGANGKATFENWLTSSGATWQTESWNADGTLADLHGYTGGMVAGQSYASYDNVYDRGALMSQHFYNANGVEVSTEVYSANSSYEIFVGGRPYSGKLINADKSYETISTSVSNNVTTTLEQFFSSAGKLQTLLAIRNGGAYLEENFNAAGAIVGQQQMLDQTKNTASGPFGGAATLDIAAFSPTSASLSYAQIAETSNAMLTVSQGQEQLQFVVNNAFSYSASNFHLGADGKNGLLVSYG